MKRALSLSTAVLGLGLLLGASPSGPATIVTVTAILPPSLLAVGPLDATAPLDRVYIEAYPEPSPAPMVPAADLDALQRSFRGMFRSDRTERTLFDVNLGAMAALNIADYLSTRACLRQPGLHEANPLMKPFAKSDLAFAAVKLGTGLACHFGMKSLFRYNKAVGWVMAAATNVLLGYAVVNNMRLLQRARAVR